MPVSETLLRLAWQIQPAKDARERLMQARYLGSLPATTAGVVGVLYVYGSGPGAEIVAWLQPTGDKSLRRLSVRLKRSIDSTNAGAPVADRHLGTCNCMDVLIELAHARWAPELAGQLGQEVSA